MIFSTRFSLALLAWGSGTVRACDIKARAEMTTLPTPTSTVMATSTATAYLSSSVASQADTVTTLLPITTSPVSSVTTTLQSNVTVTNTQVVTESTTVLSTIWATITVTTAPSGTTSVPAPSKISTGLTPSNSTIFTPTGATTSTRIPYLAAPTPVNCPRDNGTLTRPDGVVKHLVQCDIDWVVPEGGNYTRGLGESYQRTYEGCSKSCVGDPQKFCQAFVYNPTGAKPGVPNCFLRKFGNTSAISRIGFWGGVAFHEGVVGVNEGLPIVG